MENTECISDTAGRKEYIYDVVERNAIDRSRFVLSVLIVLYHIGWPYPDYAYGWKYDLFMLLKRMGDICTLSFALMSAWLYWSNMHDFKQVFYKIYSRIKSMFIPYILWCILGTIYVIISNGRKNMFNYIKEYDWFRSIVLGDAMPHFWYVFMLLFYVLVSPVLWCAYRNKLITGLLIVFSTISVFAQGSHLKYSTFVYIAYMWGGALGIYGRRYVKRIFVRCPAWFAGILFCLFYIVEWHCEGNVLLYYLRLCQTIAFFIIMYKAHWPIKNFMQFSFWVYATHYYLDYRIDKFLAGYGIDPLLIQGLTFVLTLGIATGSGMLCKKFLKRVYYTLCGGR